MKKWSTMPETQFLKIFFSFFSLSFLIAAFFMPDRTQMLAGLWQIIRSPAKAPTNYFSVGGYAATFLNMALVGFICTGLYCLPGRKANNAATLVIPLTVGFTIDGVAMALCVGLLVGYFNLVGAEFNGIVFGSVFCMLSTCNSGSHPLNIMPIIIGYALAARLFQFLAPYNGGEFTQFLYSQNIIVGICYANGLSPIYSEYGFQYGFLAAFMHFCMVTTVPQLHGGMCLYNGGFTAALVCLLLVPGLEKHARNKQERRDSHMEHFLRNLPFFGNHFTSHH